MKWGKLFTFASGIMGVAAVLALAHCDTRLLFDPLEASALAVSLYG